VAIAEAGTSGRSALSRSPVRIRRILAVAALGTACAAGTTDAPPVAAPRDGAEPPPDAAPDAAEPTVDPDPLPSSSPVAACAGLDAVESAEDTDRARAHFVDGTRAFEEARFDAAATAFCAAYRAASRPELLYNVSVALERLGDRAGAVRALELFRDRAPDSPMRDEVERRIRVLGGE
jgi:hypothetical protein